MRRLIIAPLDVIDKNKDYFEPKGGAHWLGLEGHDADPIKQLVVCSVDFINEEIEDFFLSLPGVVELPDPIFDGHVQLKDHAANPDTRYQKGHHDKLLNTFTNLREHHTVFDLSEITSSHNNLVKVGKSKTSRKSR